MRKSLFTLMFLFVFGNSFCQSTEGITGISDTSYSTTIAYNSSKKKFPQISIAEMKHPASVKEVFDITFSKTKERKLKLDVFSPQKKAMSNRTAIVIIFGGGWRSGNKTMHHPLAESLAVLGYTCFTPDYRLSTEALYPAAVYDVKAAIRWVKQQAKKYNIDSEKIAVLGFSAGGQLATLAGVTNDNPAFEGDDFNLKYSSAANAIVDIDGTLSFVHPESGEGDDSKKKSAATLWFGYSKKENPEMWKQASPLTYAGPRTPPTLFINSAVERMHAGREDFIKILTANNIYTEVKTFENSPHHFCLFHPWFEPTVQYIDQFVKKVLP